jgi:hypothetical protein
MTGENNLPTPPGCCVRQLVTEATILMRCLAVVAGLAHRLPIVRIPEQFHVATMGDDVINDCCYGDELAAFVAVRALAQWMCAQVCLASLLPSGTIATLC